MKSSSYVAYYFYKFVALMLVLFAIASLFAVLWPEHSFHGPPLSEAAWWELLALLGVSFLFFPLAKFMFFRIRVIRYDEDCVEIINGGESRTVKWEDVWRVSKVPAVTPPLYRMTFNDNSEPAYFVMSMSFYMSVVFWSWDFTGFYKFAKRKTEGPVDRRAGF